MAAKKPVVGAPESVVPPVDKPKAPPVVLTTRYRALKTFMHDQLGTITKGQEFDATPLQIASVRRAVEIARELE